MYAHFHFGAFQVFYQVDIKANSGQIWESAKTFARNAFIFIEIRKIGN